MAWAPIENSVPESVKPLPAVYVVLVSVSVSISVTQEKLDPSEDKTCPAPQVGRVVFANQ